MLALLTGPHIRRPEEVGRTETAVGLAVLLLLVGIVVAFVTHVSTNRDFLFTADETSHSGAERPRELAVASQMLPSLGEAGWRRIGEPQAFANNMLQTAVGPDELVFAEAGVQWVYRGRYATADPGPGRIEVIVCDVASPTQARELWRTQKPSGAESLNVGKGGWLSGDLRQAAFWSGRHYTRLSIADGQAGTIQLEQLADALAALQLRYGPAVQRDSQGAEYPHTSRKHLYPDSTHDNPFPDLDLPEWQSPSNVARFDAENLYQKIDGRAEAYLKFQVVRLVFGTYSHRSDSERTVDVYWYQTDRPDNAYAMYRSEAPVDAARVALGREAYRAAGAVFFCQGASYVQVLPASFNDADARVSLRIAELVAERIDEYGGGSWVGAILPRQGLIPGSVEYVARRAFGLGFLDELYTAKYDIEGFQVTLFVHRADDEALARGIFHQYVRLFGENGHVIDDHRDASSIMAVGEVAGTMNVVFTQGRYLAGSIGAGAVGPVLQAARTFRDKIIRACHGPNDEPLTDAEVEP
ncbi:MAG: DUF6599 family protein [Phycisphaerae bacterium]